MGVTTSLSPVFLREAVSACCPLKAGIAARGPVCPDLSSRDEMGEGTVTAQSEDIL